MLDRALLLGLSVSLACLVGASLLEGNRLQSLVSLPALFVVLGGSLGATLVGMRSRDLEELARSVGPLLQAPDPPRRTVTDCFVALARQARCEGPLSLENSLDEVGDRVTREGIRLIVDGTPPDIIDHVMEFECTREKLRLEVVQRFFEALGGYAPTFGIIGTVLALIHTLGGLGRPETLAQGIATAFVATFYGVLFANGLFLPLATRVKAIKRERLESLEMRWTGLRALQAAEHPVRMGDRLRPFLKSEEQSA